MSLIFFGGLWSTSASVLPGKFSSSNLVFSFSFVDLTPWCCYFIWPFWVSSESGKCFQTADVVRLGHVIKFPALIASIHVSLTGNPVGAWRYVIVCGIDGKLYRLVWAEPKTIATSAILYLIKLYCIVSHWNHHVFMATIESCWRELSNGILVDVGVQNLTPNHPFPLQNTGIAASNSFWPSPPRNSYRPQLGSACPITIPLIHGMDP